MTTSTVPVEFDSAFRDALDELGVDWQPSAVPEPELIALNEPLAAALGLDPAALGSPEGIAVLAGNAVPEGAHPIAMAYAGHQFGNYSPRLGDGRALLLGEVVAPDGVRWDVHLKGSGRTPFARGGDGKAALGPMLREYLMAEAMHALGVPTTRALSVVGTGEVIHRDTPVPGGVLARVAASHVRVGTFEYAARIDAAPADEPVDQAEQGGDGLVARLAHFAIERHHPAAADADNPFLALLEAVVEAQAALVARWMEIGFIHGVMNTDNMTISGETIDYGPCAFLDVYDPATVYSSIDRQGRYAYGNQPSIAQWNLARLAETLLPLIDPPGPDADQPVTEGAIEAATEVLNTFPGRFRGHWRAGMAAKLGLAGAGVPNPVDRPAEAATGDEERELTDEFLGLLQANQVDYTGSFRALADRLRTPADASANDLLSPVDGFEAWELRWRAAVERRTPDSSAVAEAMDAVNPVYIPRNHLVEEALAAAVAVGDRSLFHRLLDVLARPFETREGLERYAEPAPEGFSASYQTFCGT
jgi:uncharacterized protein YdiU (UPF0061 family)